MPAIKFISEVLPKKSQILVTHSRLHLSREIVRQLTKYEYVETIPVEDPNTDLPPLESLAVIVHLVGFDNPSLAQTLSFTSGTYRLLELARQHHAKFIIVTPPAHNHLYHTTLTLINQYAKNFSISYAVIEAASSLAVVDTASAIIQKFIKDHKVFDLPRLKQLPSRGNLSMSPAIPHRPRLKQFEVKLTKRKILFSFIVLLLPVLLFYASLIGVFITFSCSNSALHQLELQKASGCVKYMKSFISVAEVFRPLVLVTDPIASRLGYPLNSTFDLLDSYHTTVQNAYLLNQEAARQYRLFMNQSPGRVETGRLLNLLSINSESLAQLQSDLRNFYTLKPNPSSQIAQLTVTTTQARENISRLINLGGDINKFIASTQDLTYLFAILDNNELRPDGGVVDAVVFLAARDGRLANLQAYSAASADSQITGVIEPPADLAQVSGKDRWLFRDSGWDSDSLTSARRLSWFTQKAYSKNPDVVVWLNLHTLKRLLEITGPIKLTDPNTTLSAENFQTQYIALLKSGPDKQLIFDIANELIEKTRNFNDRQTERFVALLISELDQHQVRIVPLSFTSAALNSSGWSGEVGLSSCRSELPCFSDFILASDSNVSSNKTDFYINNSSELDINVSPVQVSSIYRRKASNSAPDYSWPAGNNKNFLRFFLPPSAKVEQILLNGEEIPRGKYSFSPVRGLVLYSLLVETDANSASELEIHYSQPLAVSSRFHYQIDLPNQPGAKPSSLKINVSYPPDWFALAYSNPHVASPSVASPGLLGYNTDTSHPVRLDLDFTPPTK